MQNNTILFDHVKSHFDQLQRTRSKPEKIPDYLYEKVKLLIGHYSLTTLAEKWCISNNQMQEHLDVDNTVNSIEIRTEKSSPSIFPRSLSVSMSDKA